MKQKLLGLLICLLLALSSCSFSAGEDPASPPEPEPIASACNFPQRLPEDKRVDGDRFSIEGQETLGGCGGIPEMYVWYGVRDLYQSSQDIVYGKVTDLGYWSKSGAAHTLYDFTVLKSYKGDLLPGDRITVLAPGGYMLASDSYRVANPEAAQQVEESEGVYFNRFYATPGIEREDQYLLFLGDIEDMPPFPKGTYGEVGGFQGRFYYKSENILMRHEPEYETSFYYDWRTKSMPRQEFSLPDLEREIYMAERYFTLHP